MVSLLYFTPEHSKIWRGSSYKLMVLNIFISFPEKKFENTSLKKLKNV